MCGLRVPRARASAAVSAGHNGGPASSNDDDDANDDEEDARNWGEVSGDASRRGGVRSRLSPVIVAAAA
jgi:hypothetical protein